MRTFGPSADPVTRLNRGVMAMSSAVVVIVAAPMPYVFVRKRPPLAMDAQGWLPVGEPVLAPLCGR